jgi:hypothetical protein
METKASPYRVSDLTPGRRVWLNTLDMSWPRHVVYGLLEVDVTVPRSLIAEHKARTGEALSFTGYLTSCLARAVDEDKSVQTYLKARKQVVTFDDVDVGVMVEGQVGDKRALMGHVIHAANRKTFREIHDEIRRVQSEPVPPGRGMPGWFRTAMLLPWPLSNLAKSLLAWFMGRDPTVPVAMAGTVSISSVGMFGGGRSGWGISPTPQPLAVVVGGIAWKPAVVDGRMEPREMLSLTIMFNHEVIDGGPATRFTKRLLDLIESGSGLEDEDSPTGIRPEPVPAEA